MDCQAVVRCVGSSIYQPLPVQARSLRPRETVEVTRSARLNGHSYTIFISEQCELVSMN